MTRRSRTSVAYLCIVVVALTAFLPGVAAFDYVVPELPWILLPDLAAAAVVPAPLGDEQSSSLLSLVSSRAPPPAFS